MADILLVEDNQELAELIQTFLSKEGWTCYPVINGEDALSWLFNHLQSDSFGYYVTRHGWLCILSDCPST